MACRCCLPTWGLRAPRLPSLALCLCAALCKTRCIKLLSWHYQHRETDLLFPSTPGKVLKQQVPSPGWHCGGSRQPWLGVRAEPAGTAHGVEGEHGWPWPLTRCFLLPKPRLYPSIHHPFCSLSWLRASGSAEVFQALTVQRCACLRVFPVISPR